MALLLGVGTLAMDAQSVQAADRVYNAYQNSYRTWADTVESYLFALPDGTLISIQNDISEEAVIVQYYDSSYTLRRTKKIALELPIFGAFYTDGEYYYLLTGQENPKESDKVEVFRITRYDMAWNRLGSDGIYGGNTYVPFEAGSARMISDGDKLLVRTCHTMYKSSDGLHHQANVTLEFDIETMKFTDSYTGIMNVSYGYVSHSFNQFIQLDGSQIVAVDHGDAYPRSVVLAKYNTDYTQGTFVPDFDSRCSLAHMVKIPGNIGANYTGVSVGGFEISSSNYLVVGTATDLTNQATYAAATTSDIFVSVVPRDLSANPVFTYLTSYENGTNTAYTPHLLKVSEDEFWVLWNRGSNQICYVKLDGAGKPVTEIFQIQGSLSDCAPIVYKDKIIWYTCDYNSSGTLVKTFYEISLEENSYYGMVQEKVASEPVKEQFGTVAKTGIYALSTRTNAQQFPITNDDGITFEMDEDGDIRAYRADGTMLRDKFVCDGIYTYYMQYDGTAMRDRLTYHPDGEHVIYFDENGHEVFSNFAHVAQSIEGDAVDDYCFFDVHGYLYVDVVTYDQPGENLYYANPCGVLERDGWFVFSDRVKCADGTPWKGAAGQVGCANPDGTLVTDMRMTDWLCRECYIPANGAVTY